MIRAVDDPERCTVHVDQRSAQLNLAGLWPNIGNLVELLVQRACVHIRFLHGASTVAKGGALVFVGASTHGKTTLALGLERRGHTIIAEDLVPLDLATGRVYPFPTEPTVRAFTRTLLAADGDLQARKCLFARQATDTFPVRWLFLLDTLAKPATRTLDVTPALMEWDKMYELCNGERPPKSPRRTTMLTQRDERDFACEPELRECPQSTAARFLMNHMHVPHPSLKEMLPALARFFEEVNLFTLKPGYLDKTVDLILDAMQE